MIEKRFNIGKINITNGVFLAPMEGITDLPFRIICRSLGADIVYTEFIASEALIRDVPKSFRKLLIAKEERPIGVQIFGSVPEVMAQAAHIAEEEGADFVDINYGCWVKKVVNNNAGSALMKSPDLMAEITNKCVNKVKIPVTIKTRLGWDKNNINIFEIAKLQEAAGAQAITVHCRTRDMKITGVADWTHIPKIKSNINIPLIVNGDIASPELALKAISTSGADAIMIGRAAVGNPFIFRESKHLINTGEKLNPTSVLEKINICIKHLEQNAEHKGTQGVFEFRKHYSGYLRGMFCASSIRQKLVLIENIDDIRNLLWEYYNFLEVNNRLDFHINSEIPKVTCRRT